MTEEYTSMTEIGGYYGVTSHRVGKWLSELNLRTESKMPSQLAFKFNLVMELPSTNPGTYFWGWHEEKILSLLDEAGHPRASHATNN